MEPIKTITSPQNPLVKKVLLLKEKSRERKKTGTFIIEGRRELELALKGGYQMEHILYCPGTMDGNPLPSELNKSVELIEISPEIYGKLAHRETTEGIMAIARTKDHSLDSIAFQRKNPLILVAEAPEKPGNIGALLRTADAANVDAVLIANPKTDLYNPNIVRSSVGCVFTIPVAMGSTDEILTYLQKHSVKVFCAALTASENYAHCDYTAPTAIVVGTEATGLSDKWLQNSHQNIIIPMQGEIDSMNVSVSAAILIFEAKRQRNFG